MRTLSTKTINLEKMGYHLSRKSPFNFFDYLFLSAELEILDLATGYTNEVMVMVGILTKEIIQFTIRVNNFDYQTALRQVF
jgi:hypothetical protein